MIKQSALVPDLKVYSLILAASFYVINKYISTKNPKSKILAYSDFALASCAQEHVLLMLH